MHGRAAGQPRVPQNLRQRHVGQRAAQPLGRREQQAGPIAQRPDRLEHSERRVRERDAMFRRNLHPWRRDAPLARLEVDLVLGRAARFPRPASGERHEAQARFRRLRRPGCFDEFQRVSHLPVGQRPEVRRYGRHRGQRGTTPRRIVANVEHHVGELFPRVGFIVTNLLLSNRAVVRFYNKRGTAEQWIMEGKQAAHWTRLSCHRFRANAVRLHLSVLAYTLGNLWRRLVLPKHIHSWSLTSLQQRLVKTGGRLVKHARYYWLLLAESHLTRRLFGAMLQRIWALPVPAG